MPKSEKEVVAAEEKKTVEEKETATEEPGVGKKTDVVKKTEVVKKTDAVFVSSSPVGSKEYTDELAAFELAHDIKAVVEPESPK